MEVILAAAAAAWPEQPDKAGRVALCELGGYANPDAFDLDAPFGGPMQLHRATWLPYFEAQGVPWRAVVQDLPTHFAAARVVYDQTDWRSWPICGLR